LHWRAPERVLADSARAALILERVRAIPKGFVQAYSDIDPHAPRFVGHVLSAGSPNVPWHRVVRSDGTVACGKRQLKLLRNEGVPLRGVRVDMEAARLPRDIKARNRTRRRGPNYT